MDKIFKENEKCKHNLHLHTDNQEELPGIIEKIIDSCFDDNCFTHIDHEPIPSRREIITIVKEFIKLLYPGYFSKDKVDPLNLSYKVGLSVSNLYKKLSQQIINSFRHECFRYDKPCEVCIEKGYNATTEFFKTIPKIRQTLATDVRAMFDGDPAAETHDEIIFSYPGIFAITIYRVAHELYKLEIPLIPRIMTEYAHSLTGIDIHPGASIEESFAIDHGTGVVIGETTNIGKNVRIYQGVTLGAISLPKDAGKTLKGVKRHPTLEDGVIVYSGTTILGGETTIGKNSVIGGNVWLTESVPADTKVFIEEPKLIYRHKTKKGL